MEVLVPDQRKLAFMRGSEIMALTGQTTVDNCCAEGGNVFSAVWCVYTNATADEGFDDS